MDPHVCIVKIGLILDLKAQFLKGLKPTLERTKKVFRMDTNLEKYLSTLVTD